MVVLMVDDSEFVLGALTSVLRRARHRVLLARNLAAARRICSRTTLPLDLVLSDIQLPDGSGLTLAGELAAARPSLPVVLMSGAYRRNDPVLMPHLGPGRIFLPKPFIPRVLLERIDEVVPAAPRRLAAAAGGSASEVAPQS